MSKENGENSVPQEETKNWEIGEVRPEVGKSLQEPAEIGHKPLPIMSSYDRLTDPENQNTF